MQEDMGRREGSSSCVGFRLSTSGGGLAVGFLICSGGGERLLVCLWSEAVSLQRLWWSMSMPSSELASLALQSPLVELEWALKEGEGDCGCGGGGGAARVGEGRELVDEQGDCDSDAERGAVRVGEGRWQVELSQLPTKI